MKTYSEIVFRFTFLVAVIFCIGLNTYSHSLEQTYTIAITSNYSTLESFNSSDVDVYDDEQMSETGCIYPDVESIARLVLSRKSKLVHNHLLSIWQPPKLC